jgi:hypothetical protein
MNATLSFLAVFAILFAPFFLFLAVLRFVPPEKRLRIIPKPLREIRNVPPWVVLLLEGLAWLF